MPLLSRIVEFFASTKLMRPRRKFMEMFPTLLFCYEPDRVELIELIRKVREEADLRYFDNEACQLFMCVKSTGKIEGDAAEVGVYRGGSARIICEAKGSRRLHLFDTFEGIPRVDEIDRPVFHKGQYAASLKNVESYLGNYEGVLFHKGMFPNTAEAVKNSTFSFVHLDVDTYVSAIKCLQFFYPRLARGGVIVAHDYRSSPGVTKAVEEFFNDKPEPIIEMLGRQCLVVKAS